jgi:hypothetical protein
MTPDERTLVKTFESAARQLTKGPATPADAEIVACLAAQVAAIVADGADLEELALQRLVDTTEALLLCFVQPEGVEAAVEAWQQAQGELLQLRLKALTSG